MATGAVAYNDRSHSCALMVMAAANWILSHRFADRGNGSREILDSPGLIADYGEIAVRCYRTFSAIYRETINEIRI
jgi:hypothetical protein